MLLEAGTLGKGASSRAAGMVRAQGGTEAAVRLGLWTRDFYRGQRDELVIDSGFVEQGYCMPCFTAAEVDAAHERIAMQQRLGLDVRWLEPAEFDELQPLGRAGSHPRARRTRRVTAGSTRRATCSPTPRLSSPAASRCTRASRSPGSGRRVVR